jgi:hypothetical protein
MSYKQVANRRQELGIALRARALVASNKVRHPASSHQSTAASASDARLGHHRGYHRYRGRRRRPCRRRPGLRPGCSPWGLSLPAQCSAVEVRDVRARLRLRGCWGAQPLTEYRPKGAYPNEQKTAVDYGKGQPGPALLRAFAALAGHAGAIPLQELRCAGDQGADSQAQ